VAPTEPSNRCRTQDLERSLLERGRGDETTPAHIETPRTADEPSADLARGYDAIEDLDELDDDSETVFAIMGGSVRRGRWQPPARIDAYSLMGGVTLDFRDAEMLEGVTEVHAYTMWGGINIIVPPDIHVDVNGMGLMGGFDHVAHRAEAEDAPTLRVRGVALMAGVSVKVKSLPKKKKRKYRIK
jgi:hypothetical protein